MTLRPTRRYFLGISGAAASRQSMRSAEAAPGYTVGTKGLAVTFSGSGEISGIFMHGRRRAFSGRTKLEGCEPTGTATLSTRGMRGGLAITRALRHTATGTTVTVTERFRPTATSIRWEVEILSNDALWSAPISTEFEYPATSATRFWTAWSDPAHNNEGWRDPRVLLPLATTQWTYSNVNHNTPEHGDFIALPLATFAEPAEDSALTLALSPEDCMLAMFLSTEAAGKLAFARHDHRLGGGRPVRFNMDLTVHEADWRGGLRWFSTRYPNFFDPPNPQAGEMAGCGGYSGSEAPIDVARLRAMSFRVNWKLSDDFAWMGMFLPPLANADETWERACDEPNPPGKPRTTSFRRLNDYATYMRSNGFHVLDYFNVTELGRKLKKDFKADPDRRSDPDLWKDPDSYIQLRLPDAHLRPHIDTFYGAWVSDCGDPEYQRFLLEQAQRHVDRIPASSGICVDRMDWLRYYNANADDGVSWKNGAPARALCQSWKSLMAKLGPLMHRAGKVIFVNPMSMRVDLMREADGFYSEHGESGPGLNSLALVAMRKPAITWTCMSFETPVYDLKPDPDSFFQRHLLMGVYPTAPYPFNNHALGPHPETDRHYLAYGPLMDAMRGKKWVLAARCVEVRTPGVRVNLFEVPGGYSLPVVFGGAHAFATVMVRNVKDVERLRASAVHPGKAAAEAVEASLVSGTLTLRVPLHRGCAMVRLRRPDGGAVMPPA